MFTKKQTFTREEVEEEVREAVSDAKERIRTEFSHEHTMEIKKLESDQLIALQEKDFQIKHFESEQMKKLQEENVQLKQDLAVEKKTNEMLNKLTDLNADVVDVKDLVTKLINKLPTVNITSGVGGGNTSSNGNSTA